MKWVGLGLAAVIIFFVGRWTSSPHDQAQPDSEKVATEVGGDENCVAKSASLKLAIDQILAAEFESYKKQQQLETKVQVLERIVGRIFLAFLAHLTDFKLSPDDESLAQKMSNRPVRMPSVNERTRPDGYPELPPNSNVDVFGEDMTPPPEGDVAPRDPSALGDAPPVEDSWQITPPADDQVDQFLVQNRYPDFLMTLRNSQFFEKNELGLANLQGTYSGQVDFDDPGQERWDITIELSATVEEQGIAGRYLIELAKGGEPFSTRRGNGSIKEAFRRTKAGGVLLLEASDSRYFQLYYVNGQDRFIGNYYERTGPGEYKALGKVKLHRS